MKKLKLNLNELKVESFETSANLLAKKGTIHGLAGYTDTCPNVGTCNRDFYQCQITYHCGGGATTYPYCVPDSDALAGCDTGAPPLP